MIVRCDAVKNYIFLLEIHSCKRLDCNMGSSQELHVIIVFLTGARLNNLIPTTYWGDKFEM